jgi:signal transduction histidine kinase
MERPRILAADDEEFNLKMYEYNLVNNGYEVKTAKNGREAVDMACKVLPDAILLDIMMPVMDGLTACNIIKSDDKTKNIPIIIISSRSAVQDIIDGLKAGANEYLTKPFHIEELLLRVKSMVELKKAHDELRNINYNLEEEVKRKTDQLLEASRFELIGKMASGLGHDLNNLLTGVIGYNLLACEATSLEQSKRFIEKQNSPLNLCHNFVKNLLNFSKVQKPSLTLFDPREGIETTLGILSEKLKTRSIKHEVVEEEKSMIYGDEGQFNQICLNIISNAIDAIESNGKIVIKIRPEDKYTKVAFADDGPGIKKENLDKVFDYLYSTKSKKQSSGIGLYTTKKIIEGLNGRVDLASEEGVGTVFTILLPNETRAPAKISQASL